MAWPWEELPRLPQISLCLAPTACDASWTRQERHWRLTGTLLYKITLPPIVGGHTVYSLDPGGILYALDIDTGLARAKLSLGLAVPHFATPTLSQGRIFVGTMVGVSAVTLA